MRNLSDINSWKQNFGLLPIHINPINQDNKFLMLNGGGGDFCLQTSDINENIDSYYEFAWSTNTKNFVKINQNSVEIYNWLDKKPEEIKKNIIETDTNKFYNYLLSKSYNTASDVVPFVLDIFRKLRNVTFQSEKPSDALNLLFKLLISLEEDFSNIDYNKWGIADITPPHQFDYFVDLIKKGVKSINPNLDLILRHSAGKLFQEAHREVIYFNPQRDLFGGISSKLITKEDAYSSVHYTPQYLARTIVENSLKNLDITKNILKIFDPACGSSEFLIESLKQLKNLGYNGKIIINGWDTSESAVYTSNFLLQYEKRTQWSNNNLDFEIKLVNDSLQEEWENDYDLILMNPPFVSWELLKDKEKRDAIITALGTSFYKGRPNQASAFFYKSIFSLKSDGVIGCILPSSILTSDSYGKLRDEIKEISQINIVAKLGNFIFEDALTDVSFFIGTKKESREVPKILWSKNDKGIVHEALRDLRKMESNNQLSIDEKNYSIYSPYTFPIIADSWKIISMEENKFIKDLEIFLSSGQLSNISDIFKINQGALVGIKNIFKIQQKDYLKLPKKEQNYFRPVITNDSIKCGKISIVEYLWYPYDKDGIIIKNKDELNSISFAVNNLIPNKDVLKRRKGINEWWGLTRPRNWQFQKESRLYSNRFGNSDSFGFDNIGNCVIEEGNAFIPRRVFKENDYYFYLSCFSSNTFDKLLSIFSKQIMSGFDLGQIQIKNIPVPNIHLTSVSKSDAYVKLVELGKELEKGNSFVKQVIDDVLKNYFYPRS